MKLREARYDLRLDGEKFSGSAAPVLARAVDEAQYVLIGEEHLSREIPAFTTAVYNVMAPRGLSAVAVKTGPQVARLVTATLGKPDRLTRMQSLTSQYPDSVAFLNIRQENDLVDRCAQLAHNPEFQIWGLDQEFFGAAGWLIDKILATHPGARSTALLNHLRAEEQRSAALAEQSGNPASS